MDEPRNTLYQRVLGENFAQLPPVLRAFHALPQGGQARGFVKVQHGCGWLRRVLARLLRLPPQGERVEVRLQVQTKNEGEIWLRHFDGVPVQTLQWQRDNYLIEKAGPLCFAFYVSANENELRFNFSHNEIGGFRLPFPVLRVDAVARGKENFWHIQVKIRAPLFGLLAEYRGEITPC